MRTFFVGLLICAAAFAATPSTRPAPPTTPVGPIDRPAVIDIHKPAFVPKFAQVQNLPAGQFEERNYAFKYGYPGPAIYGAYGGCGWAFGDYGFGYGAGNYGSTSVAFR